MYQIRTALLGRWQYLVAFVGLVLALPALGVDVGGEVVEVLLPDITEELPESEGVLNGDCLNISLKNSDWSWDGDEGQQDQGETALLVRKLLQRLNNETQQIQNDNPNLNLTHFMRLVASRSSLMLLKIKSFARVFGHVNALYGYTCRNGKQLLRHALQRNITNDELEAFDDEISAEIDAMVDVAMDEGGSGGEETRQGEKPGTVTGEKPNEALSTKQKNRAAVRLFIRKAVIALFLSPRKLRGKDIPHLSGYINELRLTEALSDLDPSRWENSTNRHDGAGLNREVGHTIDAISGEGDMTGIAMEEDESDAWVEIFESADWFDDDDPQLRDNEEVQKRFNLEAYLFKLMSHHVNKSASCARDVTKFIKKRAKHLPNVTDGEEDFKELWNEFKSLSRQLNASRHRNSTGGPFGSRGESSDRTETQRGNPLQGAGDIMSRIRNITGRLAKGRWRGDGGIEGSFYVVLMRMAHTIDSWGRAGFLSNGTYFDAKCAPGQSAKEGATTTCKICPTDAATRNLRMLLSELDDTIGEVYDGIKDGVDKLAEGSAKDGPAKDQLTVYRLPRLALVETQITLSDKDKCTPVTLTYNITQPGEGDKPVRPSTDGDDQAESGTEGGGETGEVISYEDFSTLREEQFSLPAVPFLLGNQDAHRSIFQTRGIAFDEASFVSDTQLTVTGTFCEIDSRVLELCLTLDGRTRIRTDDAPEGKCHNFTVYAAAPAVSAARLSDRADAIIVFFNKEVDVTNLRKCSAIFDETSVAKFGKDAQCQWRKGRELLVRLGKGTTIDALSEGEIALRSDHIRAYRQRFSYTASGMVRVLLPNKPVTPTAVIYGEPKVPECGDIRLSGRRSMGGGSRGLNLTWSIQSPTEDVDEGITDILEITNDANKAELVVSASLLPDDTPYVMRLTVRNVLGLENSTTFTVRKANEQEPKFKIRTIGIPADKVVNVNKPVSLIGDLSFNGRGPGCGKLNASEVNFKWLVSGAQFEEGVLKMNKRGLRFPPKSLPGNTEITATLTLTYMAVTQMTLTRTVTFTTAYEPLVARIKGGERMTTGEASDPFKLDCSLSRDPNFNGDGPDEGLGFRWGCWQETDKTECSNTSTSPEAVLTVDPSELTAGKAYSFSCYVTKAGFDEEVHSSVTVDVAENDPPQISLALLQSKDGSFRPRRDVEIRANVRGNDISEMSWEDVGGGLDGLGEDEYTAFKDVTQTDAETTVTTTEVTSSTKPYTVTFGQYYSLLKINKASLEAGSQYRVQFSALNGEEMGSSTIDFQILGKVTGCQFEFGGDDTYVDTASDVMYTVQSCSADEDKVLTYQAFAQVALEDGQSSSRLLGQTSELPELQVDHDVYDKVKSKIEAGETVPFKVGVRVCYQLTKVCADFTKDVTYVHQALTAEDIDAKKEEINDLKKEGRPVEGLKTANSVQKASADLSTGAARKRRASISFDRALLELQKELLILAAGDQSNFDGYPGDVLSMVDAAIEVPIPAYQREEIRSILDAQKNVLQSAKDLDDRLPQETIDGVRQQLEDAKIAFTDSIFFTENREILGLLSKCMGKNLATGERISSGGDDILITIEATLNIDPIMIPKGNGSITFKGGDDIRNRYDTSWEGCGCEECVGVLVEFFIYRGEDYVAGESHDSDVIGMQFVNPCTGDPIEVHDLYDPATISIPFSAPWPSMSRPVCSYYDDATMEWSQDGVQTIVDGMEVRCETNHTTEYVIDFVIEDGAVAESTSSTFTRGDDMTTPEDDDDGDNEISGLTALLGMGIGVIVGIVVGVIVILAIIVILIVVVLKNVNKPKMIVSPAVKA